ncbi:peptidylprolyl isomerase [Bacillus piscicola]|uniref:peptidylprolyl isomerase n=1 Tax=Bacillus piscicola TaxID=1632684 RepID=UPI001F08B296|nr:peptidylprolyl isomerase [Bacillus piscicola]
MNKLILAVGLSTALLLTACSDDQAADNSKTIVEVNKTNLTEDEFVGELKDRFGKQILNDMVNSVIIEDKAEELGIDSKTIDKELESFKENYGLEDNEQLLTMMQTQFQLPVDSIEEFKTEVIKPQLVLEQLATADVEITEKDKKEYYKENKKSLEAVKARHILVEDKETANKVINKLKDGEEFVKLAEKYSKDPGSAENGGDLGTFRRGEMVEEFEKAAFSLEPGEISEPVKTENGYHVIEVLDKKDTYKKLEKDIEETMRQEQAKSGEEVMQELREEAKINMKESSYEDWVQTPDKK